MQRLLIAQVDKDQYQIEWVNKEGEARSYTLSATNAQEAVILLLHRKPEVLKG